MESTLPHLIHVGLMMDGNGRWATRRGLTRSKGHEAGVMAIRRVVEAAPTLGVGALTLYAFSADNWRRPADEVGGLLRLLRLFLDVEARRLANAGVRLRVIGRRDRLPPALTGAIARAERIASAGETLLLRVAFDYSGRDEILSAARSASGAPALDRDSFSRLVSGEERFRDVDFIIRTGGEHRLSDFLLWEGAYAELCFLDMLWPDFTAEDFAAAIADFRRRDRRFGGVSAAAAGS